MLAKPPVAYVETGAARTPLAVSSWCQRGRCGAPITASKGVAAARRGQLVRCVFGFTPAQVTVSIGGRTMAVERTGNEIDWRATSGGGLTITASAPGLWVTYVGRLQVR